ncbi:hypothetical protein BIWAKO_01012 [Bosea sp. BIWAKO-01]|nr:hypothetical protein BIWAKO_01012 [Bosea sp. BIWAKO-01]
MRHEGAEAEEWRRDRVWLQSSHHSGSMAGVGGRSSSRSK